jgi:hypothetical protein
VTSGGAPIAASEARPACHVFAAEGTQHVFYRASDGRIVELWWSGGDPARWGYLTNSGNGAPQAAGDPASHVFVAEGTQHVFYRTADGRIVELWWAAGGPARWGYLTTPGNGAPAATGTPACHVFAAEGSQHVFYREGSGDVIELWWRGGENAQVKDLNLAAGGHERAPRAHSEPVSHVFAAEGTQHVFYTSLDGDVIELWWRTGEAPHPENLTQRSLGAPPLGAFGASLVDAAEGTQHVFYIDTGGHVVELRWPNQNPPWRDLLSGGPDSARAVPLRPVSHVFAGHSTEHVFYLSQDRHIRRIGLKGNDNPSVQDLTIASSGAPLAAAGPASHVFDAEGTQHVFYVTDQGDIEEIWSTD